MFLLCPHGHKWAAVAEVSSLHDGMPHGEQGSSGGWTDIKRPHSPLYLSHQEGQAFLETVLLHFYIILITNESHVHPRPIVDKAEGDCCDWLRPIPCHLGQGTVSHEHNWCYTLLTRKKTVGRKPTVSTTEHICRILSGQWVGWGCTL